MGLGAGSGAIGPQIARLLANLIVMGSGVLGRHFLQAYKEALASALPPAIDRIAPPHSCMLTRACAARDTWQMEAPQLPARPRRKP